MENWKVVPNYKNYEVSDLGNVRSLKNNKIKMLKPGLGSSGYYNVSLEGKTYRVHQLVAICFLNHIPNKFKLVVNHKDFNRLNNHVNNLELVSARENANQKHLISSSEYTGVYYIEKRKKWRAIINFKGKSRYLGDFKDEKEASEYYENAVISINNGLEIKTKPVIKKSKYTGVTWNNSRNSWAVRITIDKKVIGLGYYKLEEIAGKAYLLAKKEFDNEQKIPNKDYVKSIVSSL